MPLLCCAQRVQIARHAWRRGGEARASKRAAPRSAHVRQKVWPQASTTGSTKIYVHTLHSRSGDGGATHTRPGSRGRRCDICAADSRTL